VLKKWKKALQAKALLSAVPIADPEITKRKIVLEKNLPSAMKPPEGCPF
jgi:peptide/nickel transport system ATP-binding protein